LAFMIHEAQYDSSKWDNGLFLNTLNKHWRNKYKNLAYPIHPSNIRMTTTLGDVFEYSIYFNKYVNGIEIYKK